MSEDEGYDADEDLLDVEDIGKVSGNNESVATSYLRILVIIKNFFENQFHSEKFK
jgi:hypothetical protein